MSDADECLHGMNLEWCSTCNGSDVEAARPHDNLGFVGGETKQDLLDELCDELGIPREKVGVGSSLPSHVFDAAAARAGVRPGSMPEIGRAITEKVGRAWTSDCDSTGSVSGGGSTVTATGLRALIDALRRL